MYVLRNVHPFEERAKEVGAEERFRDLICKGIESKRTGNEVYYTNYLTLLVQNMLCSKLHCQKGFDSIFFLYEIDAHTHSVEFRDFDPATPRKSVGYVNKFAPHKAPYCVRHLIA